MARPEISQIQLPESKWHNACLGACNMHVCRRLGHRAAQGFLRAVGTIAMSIPAKQCSRPSGNRKMHFVGPAKGIFAGTSDKAPPKSFLATAGTTANSLPSKFCLGPSGNTKMHFSAPAKMHFCRRSKIHTAPKTNAFTRARKMHFATLPERILCADNAPMRLWALLYIGSVGCREMPWSAQP